MLIGDYECGSVGQQAVLKQVDIDEVARALEANPCTLFLGSGPSIAAGGPSWPKLTSHVATSMEYDGNAPDDWWDVLDYALSAHSIDKVHECVAGALEGLPIQPWMQRLLSIDWREVYTTNYDASFQKMQSLAMSDRPPHIYHSGEVPQGDLTDRKPVFPLMGCMERNAGETGSMLLSRQDLMMRSSEVLPYYRRLKESLDDAFPLVVVGHSLSDGVLRQALRSTAEASPTGPSADVYIVTPTPPSRHDLRGMQNLRLHHVAATAQELEDRLQTVQVQAPVQATRIAQFGTKQFPLGPQSIRLIGHSGQLIDVLESGATGISREKFYESSIYLREAFEMEWDFRRDILAVDSDGKIAGVRSTVEVRQALIDQYEARDFGLALLEAGPGAAKTMTALRLAYEWTEQGGIAFYSDGSRHHGHGSEVANLVASVHNDALTAFVTAEAAPSYLVILDNYASSWHMVEEAVSQLRRSDIPRVVVLVLGRLNECPIDARSLIDLEFQLDARMREGEIQRFPDFIERAGGRPREEVAEELLRTDSYWALFWRLLDPTKPPLEEAVRAIYGELEGWQRDLAACTAVFSGLNVPILWRWARRLPAGMDLRKVISEVDDGPISNLLIRRQDDRVERLEFLNPTAAMQLVNSTIKPTHGCGGYVRRVITASRGDYEEANALEEALISGLSRSNMMDDRRRGWFSREEREALLGLAAEKVRSALMYHHHGLSLKALKQFPLAEEKLRRALREATASRRQGQIRHSLAGLYIDWAKETLDDNPAMARKHLSEARSHLELAGKGEPSYFYTAFAKWHLAMSRLQDEDTAFHVTESILHCKYGRNLERSVERRELFEGIEKDAFKVLVDSAFNMADAERVATEFRSGAGYFAIASKLVGTEALRDVGISDREEALRLVKRALDVTGSLEVAWDLRLRLVRSMDSQDTQAIRDCLEHLHSPELKCSGTLVLAAVEHEAGNIGEANRLMREAGKVDRGYEPPPQRAADLVLRDDDGPRTWPVQGHTSRPYLNVDGARIGMQAATPGTRWQVRTHQAGLRAHRKA